MQRPRSRYGRFTLKDAELLRSNIRALVDLDEGRRPPQTEAQKHFLLVSKGKAQATTQWELAYMRWRAERPDIEAMLKRAEAAQRYHDSLASSERKVERRPAVRGFKIETEFERQRREAQEAVQARRAAEAENEKLKASLGPGDQTPVAPAHLVKPYARFVEEPLGTRADFRRDRAGWKKTNT